jgi:Flp pilus assembly pilin Flp
MRSPAASTGSKDLRFSEAGQSTVEYALIAAAFAAIVVALGVLWRAVSGGDFAQIVLDALTHRLMAGLADIVLF